MDSSLQLAQLARTRVQGLYRVYGSSLGPGVYGWADDGLEFGSLSKLLTPEDPKEKQSEYKEVMEAAGVALCSQR